LKRWFAGGHLFKKASHSSTAAWLKHRTCDKNCNTQYLHYPTIPPPTKKITPTKHQLAALSSKNGSHMTKHPPRLLPLKKEGWDGLR
jgi:hypothetical protein